jgi:hypothetical protein
MSIYALTFNELPIAAGLGHEKTQKQVIGLEIVEKIREAV